jgi:hypothetical protein
MPGCLLWRGNYGGIWTKLQTAFERIWGFASCLKLIQISCAVEWLALL